MSIGEGKMFNCCLVIPLPMHNEDVFCVGASGGGEKQTTPTSHLQAFLTRHSSFKEKGTSIADIVLQFEGVGTNDSNNFEYMKNRVVRGRGLSGRTTASSSRRWSPSTRCSRRPTR